MWWIYFYRKIFGVTLSAALWGFEMVINMVIFHLQDGSWSGVRVAEECAFVKTLKHRDLLLLHYLSHQQCFFSFFLNLLRMWFNVNLILNILKQFAFIPTRLFVSHVSAAQSKNHAISGDT